LKVWIPVEGSDLIDALRGEINRKVGEPVLDIVSARRRKAADGPHAVKKVRRKRRWHKRPPEEESK
jgi:hypothetical protein